MSNAVVRVAGGKCQRDARATCTPTGGTSSDTRHRLVPTRVVMKHLFITAMILFYRLRFNLLYYRPTLYQGAPCS